MRRTLVTVLCALGTTAAVACAATPSLAPVPRPAIERCAALAPRRSIPVLCPTRLPKARWFVRYQSLAGGRSEYLTDLRTKPDGSGDPYHVLAGGRRGRFSLGTTADHRWPVHVPRTSPTCCSKPRDLGLVGARQAEQPGAWEPVRLDVRRSASVAGRRALVMAVADHPDGGVHGGHIVVVWNQGRSGYALSMHFADGSARTPAQQERVLLRAAGAMSRFAGARGR